MECVYCGSSESKLKLLNCLHTICETCVKTNKITTTTTINNVTTSGNIFSTIYFINTFTALIGFSRQSYFRLKPALPIADTSYISFGGLL